MFIGIDLGTSSVKMLLLSPSGDVLNTVIREYPIYYPKPSWSEQNPQDWYREVLIGLKELINEVDNNLIKGIGLSGQMHGMVILDENDQVIRNAILWNDQRTEKQCEYLNEVIGRENLSSYTGNIALTGFTAPKVLWLKEHEPQHFNKIHKLMLPKDFIAYKISGVFATDVSDSSGTLYFDVKNKCWSKEMLELLSIREEQLPKVFESYEVIGTIKKEIAIELGLNESVKIIIGGGDQAVASVGTGTVSDNSCNLSLGTSGVVFVSSKEFKVDKDNSLHSFAHANGKYHLMGVILSAAASLKWWVEDIQKTDDFQTLLLEAEETPIDNTVFFLPYLMGERTPINDANARGTFIGLSLNHDRKFMTRAVLEGVAFALKDSFEIIQSLGIQVSTIRINGGGTKSPLWVQTIADVLNVKVEKINSNEGPAFGAAILAAVGCGEYSDVESATQKLIKVTETIIPNGVNVKLYQDKYEVFKQIYPSVKSLFKVINRV